MKKILLAMSVALLVTGCGDSQEQLELTKMRMQMDHELRMAKVSQGAQVAPQQHPVYSEPVEYSHEQPDVVRNDSDSGSSVMGTVAAVGLGALAGYAASELLDNGHRSYTDSTGRVRYVDKSGREIKKSDYDSYKAANPTKAKISEANQKAKTAINSGATKVVDTSKNIAKKVDQKVVKPVQKKASSYKASSSSKRK
ncbi:MAG: hypothetical protein ACRC6V_08980 [Bacteroidales bacterium]